MNKFLFFLIALLGSMATIYGQETKTQSKNTFEVKMSANTKYMDDLGNELSEKQFNDSLATKKYTLTVSEAIMKLKKKQPDISNLKGTRLPSTTYVDLEGKEHKIGDIKNPALIVIWDKTCAPCHNELIELNNLAPKYSDIPFYALTADTKEAVEPFLKERGLKLNNLIIIPSYKKDYQKLLNTSIVPVTILIDREQRIQNVLIGNKVEAVKEAINNMIR